MILKPLLIALWLLAAPQPEAISGLLCFHEATSEAIAQFYLEGGQSLEDEVSDDAVTQGECVRIPEPGLQGYVVYEGATIGNKIVVGVAPNPEGPAQLYGLVWKHLPGKDEA